MKAKIDALIQKAIDNGDFVGINSAVYRDSECIYQNSAGMADRENNRPMTFDTIFRIYSMTKPVTAVAVMQMVEKGEINTDFPLSWYMPEFGDMQVYDEKGIAHPAKNELRVKDLLNMTSGMPYPNCLNQTQKDVASLFGEMESRRDGDNPIDTMEFCQKMSQIPLEFEAGTQWEYGVSADILGGLVEKVSGMNYRDYLKANIFEPLGMHDTDFYVPEEKQNRFAMAYEPKDGKLVRDEGCYLGLNNYKTLPAFISGGAGLTSTIPDYSKFANALANGGTTKDGIRILSKYSVDFIHTPQVMGERFTQDWDSLRGYSYGALVRVLTDKAGAGTIANLGEFGWDGWTGTYFCVDPIEKLVIFFWVQLSCAGTTPTAKLMRNIVYGSL